MSTVFSGDENIRQAVRWVSQQLTEHPEEGYMKWVNEAGPRFNLNPLQSDYLVKFFKESQKSE